MLSHRQGWSLAVLLAIFPCIFYASDTSDTPPTTYHTGTSEVRIAFYTTDENNRLIENIVVDDFAVVDSGKVIRGFRSLTRTSETTLDLIVLVDASDSVAPRFQQTRQDVLRLISEGASTIPEENISIVTFAGLQPQVLCAGDCLTAAKQEKLLSLRPGGMTPLFDALSFTARFLSHRRTSSVRQVLILFSDGNDNISVTSAQDALSKLVAAGALLYSVNLGSSPQNTGGDSLLQQMADATGGRSFFSHDDTVDVLESILADLRASYVVTYSLPSRALGFHSLRILPKHNLNLRFHCRRGYFYEENQ
ncbi:MAG: VWA domain-containing protein [Candidatus Sulfotelmatobacter sp.]